MNVRVKVKDQGVKEDKSEVLGNLFQNLIELR